MFFANKKKAKRPCSGFVFYINNSPISEESSLELIHQTCHHSDTGLHLRFTVSIHSEETMAYWNLWYIRITCDDNTPPWWKIPTIILCWKNKPEVGTNKCKEGIKQSWWSKKNYVTSRLFSILPISAWSKWKITASQRTYRYILVGGVCKPRNHGTVRTSKVQSINTPQLPTYEYFPTQLQDFEIMRKHTYQTYCWWKKILHTPLSGGTKRWLYLNDNTFSYPAKRCRIFSIKRTIAGG